MRLVTVNVGSSSVRLAAFDEAERLLAEWHAEQAAGPIAGAPGSSEPGAGATLRQFVLGLPGGARPEAVLFAHRVVHGGERLTGACRVDAAVEAEIERLGELAPLHNPVALAWIRAARAQFPAAAQVAVFDTAFFHALPPVARRYALPGALSERLALHRYGFHGLAHRALWRSWERVRAPGAGGRVLSLQLGSGCSIAAVRDGAPLDTSMGFSPLEGLVMGTRCGDIDPGLLLFLQRREGWTAQRLEHLLSHECGLLGVSGLSADVRVLTAAAAGAGEAALRAAAALDLFCYRARKYVGACLAVLGGADAVLFGGGIGEHAPQIRSGILQGLEWAGIRLDTARNVAAIGAERRISADDSRVEVWVAPVEEARVLAADARALLVRDGVSAGLAAPEAGTGTREA